MIEPIGADEHGGVPSRPRPDTVPPPHWRLDAVVATPRPHHPVVSPDGARVAYLLDDHASDVWVLTLADRGLRRLTTDRPLHAYWADTPPDWSPDGSRIAYVSEGVVWVVPAAGGPPRRVGEGASPRWFDDRTLLVAVDRDEVDRACLVDVDDPWPRPVTPPGVGIVEAVPDGASRMVVYVRSDPGDRRHTVVERVDLGGGEPRRLGGADGFASSAPAVSPSGRIVFTSERSGWSELYLADPERQLTTASVDFSAPAWNGSGTRIVAVATRAGRDDLVTVDPDDGTVSVLARGGTWNRPQWTGEEVVAVHEDHRTPPRLVMVESDGTIVPLVDPAPAAVAAAPHVAPGEVCFPSSDGREIPGLLFRPAVGGGRRPVVVYAHGGPTAHSGDEWDGHAQYFLDKGYGWLAVNFRGSTSYGLEFERAGDGVWGVADVEDCLAAFDHLAGLDWVDPRRVAIFGASYGAYLATASLASDPLHRFACGIAKYGDCDILTSWAQSDRVGREDLERMMGHPSDHPAAYRAGSPVHRVADIAGPLLIAHGERDERVHVDQSRQLVAALRAHGKAFEYVTYPTEGHGFLRPGPQLHFYRRLERFLDWHLM